MKIKIGIASIIAIFNLLIAGDANTLNNLYNNWRKDWADYRSKRSVYINGEKVVLGYDLNKFKEVMELPAARALISSKAEDPEWDVFVVSKLKPFASPVGDKVIGDEFLAFMTCYRKGWIPEKLLGNNPDDLIEGKKVLYNYFKLPSIVLERLEKELAVKKSSPD